MGSDQAICFKVNGAVKSVDVPPLTRLLDVLRYKLQLTGTKEGCGEGECGACAVLMNGQLVNSCLVPVLQASGTAVVTIEGLVDGPNLHRIQKAFLECGGAQCGMCTPGMIMASLQLLADQPHPDLDQIRDGLAGNLCRCTGYQKIFAAVQRAAEL